MYGEYVFSLVITDCFGVEYKQEWAGLLMNDGLLAQKVSFFCLEFMRLYKDYATSIPFHLKEQHILDPNHIKRMNIPYHFTHTWPLTFIRCSCGM